MLIEIVSHCWAGDLPQYANALCYQLSSLVLHKPKDCEVWITICCEEEDLSTWKVLNWFRFITKLQIFDTNQPLSYLGRRAYGRNQAAKNTQADIVWFADCDQLWRDDCLDRLAHFEWPSDVVMIYPKEIMIHKSHYVGDVDLNSVADNPRLLDIDPGDFHPKRYTRAIGGVQIVQGDFAREHGYLDIPKWQGSLDRPFSDAGRSDMAYRGYCRGFGDIIGVDLPGMYRIRHSVRGKDENRRIEDGG
jgi:hypothetical protein